MAPAYKLDEFLAACAAGTVVVYVSGGAMATAKSDFRLINQQQALNFLGAFKVDEYKFQDSCPWRNCHGATCDAYTFFDGSVDGYVSFGIPKGDTKWVVKSLKTNRRMRR